MKFIIDVVQGEEDFLFKLLESLDIVTSIEKIYITSNSINMEHAQILKESLQSWIQVKCVQEANNLNEIWK